MTQRLLAVSYTHLLQAKIKENQSKTQTLVEKKSDIDQQISMTQASIDNLNEQVQQYSLLIANKQADLEASQAEEQRLSLIHI